MSTSQMLVLVAMTLLLAAGWWYRRHAFIPWFSLSGRLRWHVLRAQRRSLLGDRRAGFVQVADTYRAAISSRVYAVHVDEIPWLQDYLADELAKGAHRLGASVKSDIEVLVVPSQDPMSRWTKVNAHRAANFEISRVELRSLEGDARLTIPAPIALLGRHPRSATVLVVDDTVSREHASIRTLDGAVSVTDHDTLNGTYHNGTRIPPEASVSLQDGDTLALGRVRFRVRIDRGLPATTALGPARASAPTSPQAHGWADQILDGAAPVGPGRARGGATGSATGTRVPTARLDGEQARTENLRR